MLSSGGKISRIPDSFQSSGTLIDTFKIMSFKASLINITSTLLYETYFHCLYHFLLLFITYVLHVNFCYSRDNKEPKLRTLYNFRNHLSSGLFHLLSFFTEEDMYEGRYRY